MPPSGRAPYLKLVTIIKSLNQWIVATYDSFIHRKTDYTIIPPTQDFNFFFLTLTLNFP